MLRHKGFDRVSPRSGDIYRNMFLYGGHLENPIWHPSAVFINGTVVFLDPENIYLDIKISIVRHIEIGFYMAANLKIQYCRYKYCEKTTRLFLGYSTS